MNSNNGLQRTIPPATMQRLEHCYQSSGPNSTNTHGSDLTQAKGDAVFNALKRLVPHGDDGLERREGTFQEKIAALALITTPAGLKRSRC